MIVRTHGLVKDYEGHHALDGVDLVVPRGSVYGLVGPNGAGKTTLLGILAGLRRASSGSVEVTVERSRIAVLPDTPQFDPWLTAREVVELAATLTMGHRSGDAIANALALAGLTQVADRRIGGFSRGMLQRLGVAATMVGDPELLLLDEPCSALDPVGRHDVLELIAMMQDRATVLLSTHLLGDVQQVCDYVGILKAGRLLFQGSLEDLLQRHAAPAWTVRVVPPLGGVVAELEKEPWVSRIETVGTRELRVTARSLEEGQAGLAPALSRAGARIASLTPDSLDLESVFLELTR